MKNKVAGGIMSNNHDFFVQIDSIAPAIYLLDHITSVETHLLRFHDYEPIFWSLEY